MKLQINTSLESQQESPMVEALTVSLAGVVDSGEVLVAAALVGTLGVVTDVGTHSELPTLVLICETT